MSTMSIMSIMSIQAAHKKRPEKKISFPALNFFIGGDERI